MNKADIYFKENLEKILTIGTKDINPRPSYKDGVKAHSIYITHVCETYDISKGEFPIPTLRTTAIKTGIKEIFWIYQKQSNILSDAHELGIHWWDEWDIGDGTIGARYGHTVKKYNLLNNLIKSIQTDPYGRRHIINLWQYDEFKTAGLNPCAYEVIFSVRGIYLDMFLNQRSSDYIMANYINKTQYLSLQMMIAYTLGYEVGKFTHFVTNLHIYDRHIPAANELLNKDSLNIQPTLELIKKDSFYLYDISDFTIKGTKNITNITSPLEIAI